MGKNDHHQMEQLWHRENIQYIYQYSIHIRYMGNYKCDKRHQYQFILMGMDILGRYRLLFQLHR